MRLRPLFCLLLLALIAAVPAPQNLRAVPATMTINGVRYSGATIFATVASVPPEYKGWWVQGYNVNIEYNGQVLGHKIVRSGQTIWGFRSGKRYFLRVYTVLTNGRNTATGPYSGAWFTAP